MTFRWWLWPSLSGLVISSILILSWVQLGHAQSAGTLTPYPSLQLFDNNGVVLNGGTISTYAAGTSTSQLTYTDAALTTAAANPIVLDSAGRATIYLAQQAYRFVVADSANVQLYTVDNVQSTAYSAAQATLVNTCDYRITLTGGTPITVADVLGATTVYVTPFQGDRCALYDGSIWNVRTFAELSLSLGSDAANTNYDLFAYDSAGTMTLQRRAWSTNTTRTTDLTTQNGVLVRVGATTARYLGTYRTTTTAGQVDDSALNRLVYNWRHPMPAPVRREDTTSTWPYTTDTFRQANATTLNRVAVVAGQIGTPVYLTVVGQAESTTVNVNFDVSIGEDGAITPMTGCPVGRQVSSRAGNALSPSAPCSIFVAVGYHTYQWLERSTASGTTTWSGNAGGTPPFSGLSGLWMGR